MTGTDRIIKTFVEEWRDNPQQTREVFLRLKSCLEGKADVTLDFISRPGVTHSLRAVRKGQRRPLFSLIDIIEDNPRWLSVCFYEEMIDDPEGRGNLVPGGIHGIDGYCFDVESFDPAQITYLETRIDQAHAGAVNF